MSQDHGAMSSFRGSIGSLAPWAWPIGWARTAASDNLDKGGGLVNMPDIRVAPPFAALFPTAAPIAIDLLLCLVRGALGLCATCSCTLHR